MSRNLSYTYLLPLLSEQVNLQKKILSFITNTYVLTNEDNRLGYFYIKCRFEYSTKEFAELEDILTSNDLYVESYDIDEEIIYKFKFPVEYQFEQHKFIEGKYSEFKDDCKSIVLEFWVELYGHIPSFVTTTLLKIRQIFNKDEKLRLKMIKELKTSIEKGSELGNKVELEDETFVFEQMKEKINLTDIKNIF